MDDNEGLKAEERSAIYDARPKAIRGTATPLTATELARNLSDCLNRVFYENVEYAVTRADQPICRIVPAARRVAFTGGQLVELLRALPRPDADYLDGVERLAKKQPKLPRSPWGR